MIRIGIATLGPKGTDSENAAINIQLKEKIKGEIILKDTFYNALDFAIENNSHFLIPAAFKRTNNEGKVVDTWGDINFRYTNEIEIVKTYNLPLKEMCIARNKNIESIDSVIIHPATEPFANAYLQGVKIHYTHSKPLAVESCAKGEYAACIGSSDVVMQNNNLEIINRFSPSMVWVLYTPKKR